MQHEWFLVWDEWLRTSQSRTPDSITQSAPSHSTFQDWCMINPGTIPKHLECQTVKAFSYPEHSPQSIQPFYQHQILNYATKLILWHASISVSTTGSSIKKLLPFATRLPDYTRQCLSLWSVHRGIPTDHLSSRCLMSLPPCLSHFIKSWQIKPPADANNLQIRWEGWQVFFTRKSQ